MATARTSASTGARTYRMRQASVPVFRRAPAVTRYTEPMTGEQFISFRKPTFRLPMARLQHGGLLHEGFFAGADSADRGRPGDTDPLCKRRIGFQRHTRASMERLGNGGV